MKFTAQEKRTIDGAWDEICFLAETGRIGELPRLKSALRRERKERSNITAAKALLIRAFTYSCRMEAGELWSMSRPLSELAMFGGSCYRHRRQEFNRARGKGIDAQAAYRAAQTRMASNLDSLTLSRASF